MLFNSQVFILLFLPLAWLAFDALRRTGRGHLAWLLLASVFFYIWWEPRDLPILLGSIVFNFLLGRALGARPGQAPRYLLGLGVSVNLGLLGWFKYRGLMASTLGDLGFQVGVPEVVLPLAISFFTFQQIAYLVDVARGLPAERSLLRYAVFVSFFPQLIAGPIVHWQEMMPAFDRVRTRDRSHDLAVGLAVFAIGLAKKVLVADSLAPSADAVFDGAARGNPTGFGDAWLAALAYGLQIYFDFSAYSDMAIGLARMFGIDLPLNFLSPYKAGNIAEFWRRWHITLSRFLRDYLYVPLGGNRHGRVRTYINLLLTMALGGLWHGAQWTFLVWGLWHGAGLALHRLWRSLRPHRSASRLALPVCVLATFLFVTLGWVLFRAQDFATAMRLYEAMFTLPSLASSGWFWEQRDTLAMVAGALALVWFAPNCAQIFAAERLGLWPRAAREGFGDTRLRFVPGFAWTLFVTLLLTVSILSLSRETVFLYFQF